MGIKHSICHITGIGFSGKIARSSKIAIQSNTNRQLCTKIPVIFTHNVITVCIATTYYPVYTGLHKEVLQYTFKTRKVNIVKFTYMLKRLPRCAPRREKQQAVKRYGNLIHMYILCTNGNLIYVSAQIDTSYMYVHK